MNGNFPEHNHEIRQSMTRLGRELPATMAAFAQLHKAAAAEGALSTKTKERIALAIGVTVRDAAATGPRGW